MTGKLEEKSDFDKMVENIQNELDAEAEAIFSKKALYECSHPVNLGRIKNPDAVGIITGPCGDTMDFFCKVEKNKLTEIKFMTNGCAPTIACGSMVSRMVIGKPLDEILKITYNDLINTLDGLPEENRHCAKLAVDTLQKAIRNYQIEEG